MDEKNILELTRIIHESILEILELKEKIAELELRISKLENPEEAEETPEKAPILLPPDVPLGTQALQDLYDEGYHVCSTSYGQKRDGECIFCYQFLQK